MNGHKTEGIWRKALGNNPGLGVLFFALLLFLMAFPLASNTTAGSLILDCLFSAMLIISAYAVSRQRKVLIIAATLGVPSLGFFWSVRLMESTPLMLTGLVLSAAFFLFIVGVLLANVISSDRVDLDTIFGAMSAYLLIGICWSLFYAMVEISDPGAFNFGAFTEATEGFAAHGELRLFSYYSLVTLSTLGYGDITPISPIARSLSAMEAVTGQLYIAVLIARLVGLHIAQKQSH